MYFEFLTDFQGGRPKGYPSIWGNPIQVQHSEVSLLGKNVIIECRIISGWVK